MNIAEEIGLSAAIDYLQDIGMDEVRAHERELGAYALGRLSEAGVKVFGPSDPNARGGVVSFWVDGAHPHDVAQVLDTEGVFVRAGHHCAQPLMRILGVPATTRASFSVYNSTEDVDALVAALGKVEEIFG